jgi:hypothetical protein
MAIRITIEVTEGAISSISFPRFFQTGTLSLRSELDEFGCADQQFGLQLCAALLQHSTLDANGMNPEILGAEILTKAGVGDEKNHRN